MKTKEEIKAGLAHFYGTEAYHRWSMLTNMVATDGVKWLAENAEAYWLLDTLASHQKTCSQDTMLRDMQFWTLTVSPDNSALLICERDSGDVAIRQKIPLTDFPLSEIKLWVQNGSYLVVMLPQEY